MSFINRTFVEPTQTVEIELVAAPSATGYATGVATAAVSLEGKTLPAAASAASGTNVNQLDDHLVEEDVEEPPRSTTDDEMEYPEGGLEAWLVVFGSWCAWTATFGLTNTIGYLQAWLSTHQLAHQSESEISWIFSIYLFLLFFGGIQVGPVFDRYGDKYLIVPGSIGLVASLVILSFCTQYYQFVLGFSVFGGISCTLVFTPTIAVIGQWFHRRRGFATSLAATGGAIGGVLFPLVLIRTMPSIGFGWSIRLMALLEAVLCILAVVFMKTRVPVQQDNTKKAVIDFNAFRDLRFTITTIAVFMIEWALFVPITYITTYALTQKVNTTFAYQLIAILNASSVFGRGLPGYFADKFGRFNVMIVTSLFCTISCLAIWLPANGHLVPLIIFTIFFGFWSGSGVSLTPVCISQICRIEDYGKYYGTCYTMVSFGTLTGTPIAGAILSHQSGNYSGVIWFSAIAYLVGALLFTYARVLSTGWKLKAIY